MFTFRVFCSSKLLADVFLDNENNPRQKFVLVKKLFLNEFISFYVDDSNYELEDYNYFKSIIDEYIIFKSSLAYDQGVAIEYYPNIKKLLKKDNLKNHYRDIFILDAPEIECEIIKKELGIFVISENSLNSLEILFSKTEFRVDKGEIFSLINNDVNPGWHTLFHLFNKENEYFIPCVNSIIIGDCYIFNSSNSRNNLISLIKGILLNGKSTNLQVSVFAKSDKSNEYYEGTILELTKEFPDADLEIFAHNNQEVLHARVILTNYVFMEDPHEKGFDLFQIESNPQCAKATRNGSLNVKNIFTDFNSIINTTNQATVIKDTQKYIKLFRKCSENIIENKNRKEGLIQIQDLKYFSNKQRNKNDEFRITNRMLL